ncbi:MAG TPA: hypothetical protein VGW76_20260 [Pyrinomonadaceae bacterium]|nr:hypothetical protein [Pyrinomonadaceae bacterium]
MTVSSFKAANWKWSALAAVPIMLLSLGPQIIFWYDRGSQWQGTYATLNADEFLYSGYVNALIEGRPRRNDPFTGRQDDATAPLPETAFSIQYIPPFILSSLAKLFGISAATSFIALAPLAGLLASLSIFWLLSSITDDHKIAGIGTLFVLLAGTFFAGQGLIGVLLKLDVVALGLPFLRRYQPAASFYLFFVFCTLIWLALDARSTRKRRLLSLLAGVSLAVLTFSYLYLWTAAVGWLVCLAILWLLLRPASDRLRSLEVFAINATIFILAAIPFGYLLSNRSQAIDELQTLISTHRPDLFRIPEIVGVVVIMMLVIFIRQRRIKLDDPRALFAGSLALAPVIVFNQQVLTGKSMQPFHYESFVVNYVALVSLVILLTLLGRPFPRAVLSWTAIVCLLLGLTEVGLVAGAFHRTDVLKDQMVPAARRLKALANQPSASGDPALVFSPHLEFMQMLPTWAPQGTLLGMGAIDFGSASHQERKEFLYTHLYYSGVTKEGLREIFRGPNDQLPLSYYVKYVVFGHERVRPLFSLNFQPITQDEIERELVAYDTFINSFSREQALKHPISYSVILTDRNFDFSNIDRWYERDTGERVGESMLYSLKLRD